MMELLSLNANVQKGYDSYVSGNSMLKAGVFLIMLGLSMHSLAGDRIEAVQSDPEIFYQKAISQINPRHARWVESTASYVNEKELDEPAVIDLATRYLGRGSGDMDVLGLTFLVMMEYLKISQNESKGITDDMAAINAKEKALQEANKELNENRRNVTRQQLDSYQSLLTEQPSRTIAPGPSANTRLRMNRQTVTAEEIDATNNQLRVQLVTLGEMEEMDKFQLQTAMDRRVKTQSTLSNLLQKISQSQESIIQNLK